MGEPGDYRFRESWWRRIENDPEVSESLIAAAYAISAAARSDGTRALISNRRLAQILRKSERTAIRRTQQLQAGGYVKLVERGGHRGDGTVAANIYELCLPDTETEAAEMSPWGESQSDTQMSHRDAAPQSDTQMSHRDEAQSDKTGSQRDKTESQSDKTASQRDTQVSHPLLSPSFPLQYPMSDSAPSAGETPPNPPTAHPTKPGRKSWMELELETERNKIKNA